MSPIDLERHLEKLDPSRRDFLRVLVLGTAYATPLVTSFSMDGLGLESAAAQAICGPNTGSNLGSNTADLAITKTASPDPAVAGADLTYTLTVANCGPIGDAPDVMVSDPLPTGATFQSSRQVSGATTFTITEPAVGSTGMTWSAQAALFPSGETAVFEIVLRVNP